MVHRLGRAGRGRLMRCNMRRHKSDPAREQRIEMEIVADAYDAEERARVWYSYLEEKLAFPFTAYCIRKRVISPLRVGDDVEVIGMAPGDECQHEMFVMMRWEKDGLAVPLAQLKAETSARARTDAGGGR